MKAEHRKELQTNVLADRLGKLYQNLKTGPQSTSLTVWILVGLVVAVVVAWFLFQRSPALPWTDLQAADDKKLEELSQKHPGTPLARVARFQEARNLLQSGQRELAASPEIAVKDLADASGRYEQLAAESTDDPLLREEALLGVATAEECLGHLDRAQDFYEKLAAVAPESPRGELAAARAKQLANERLSGGGSEIDFYKKFQAELAKAGRR
jgi:hypothetical protein